VRDLTLNSLGYLFHIVRHVDHVGATFATLLATADVHHWHAQVTRFSDTGAAIAHEHRGLREQPQEPRWR
jgi:hypothetical protein